MENLDVSGFIQAAAAASMLAKMGVDGIKMAADLPRWAPVLLAFVLAQGFELLLLVSQGATLATKSIAQAVIIGFFAWGLAIGITALQTKSNKTEEKMDAALAAPAGTTKAEIDKQVNATT